MGRRWQHEVSAEWLKARQQVLTATDVVNLMPEYKRYLKAGSPDTPSPGFSALWCKKHSDVYLDTEAASSAAARGHIMEPYAVDSWNMQASPTFYHWDDSIICNNKFGFSPDAMTVPQEYIDPTIWVAANEKMYGERSQFYYRQPAEIMEIKCYEVTQHMKAIIEDHLEKKELMQLAMAFVVLPKLESAKLLWFCPGAPISMHVEEYTRDELHDQIRWILEIGEVYEKADRYWADSLKSLPPKYAAKFTEDEIYADYLSEHERDVFLLK